MSRLLAATLLFVSAGLLAGQPASAQGRDQLVLVSPDGHIIQDVPEYGSVRMVVDIHGRRLLLNSWDEVVAIEMTLRDFRRDYGGNGRGGDFAPGRDYFPEAPRPFEGDTISAVPTYPDEAYMERTYPEAPGARIERRDINPMTGTVPAPEIIPAPNVTGQPEALPEQTPAGPNLTKPQVTALQVLLDRNGMSPGVIDGRMGSNVAKALAAWKEATGETLDPSDTKTVLDRLAAGDGLAFTEYTITASDAAGPYVASIPSDYSEKAKLERLAFTSTAEMLAEKFHMDESYLKELNPGADFTRQGTIIKVTAPGKKRSGVVASIVADKSRKQVRGYDAAGKLIVAYPATIGSSDTPSPSGEVTIQRIAHNPGYTYNPKLNFKQGNNDKILQVPPGPNGPVGSVWIALSKPTYGIHGTPEPSKIGKSASHGCVRLTNWDAEELAGMVKPGVTVSFTD